MAGTRPKRIPVRTEMPRVNSRMLRSSVTAEPSSPMRGILPGLMREQKANAGESENEPEQAAGERKRQALGQQLADDLAAAGSERGAGREFAFSTRRVPAADWPHWRRR